jgi:hypothetical protein
MDADNEVIFAGASLGKDGQYNEIIIKDQLVILNACTYVSIDEQAYILRGIEEKNGIYQFIATFGGPMPEHMKDNPKFMNIDFGVVVADIYVKYNKYTGDITVKEKFRSPFDQPYACPICDHKTGEIVGAHDWGPHGRRIDPSMAVTITHDSQ